ncbi:hypothetical protein T265_11190 [Opisthorchis viverrini]|uniref:Uncharacterized protein n=1 Tax=Opisthorchis viverrini TaxID=6198 RepID=A0A074ZYH8_OPIVI|nr:hypothetical protein T265_11190 [Opisthorchis viverrini]KER20204.1 hypothetical protein T265_11190 [Opisthorchis viverrini]
MDTRGISSGEHSESRIRSMQQNPSKGQVFNDYEHEDVYKGVIIDYLGKMLSFELIQIFLFVMRQLDAAEFNEILFYMYKIKMHKPMMVYIDACKSDSMFQDILPSNVAITDERLNTSRRPELEAISGTQLRDWYYTSKDPPKITAVWADLTEVNGNWWYSNDIDREKKYKKPVIYMDACYSGSMFRSLLPSDVRILPRIRFNTVFKLNARCDSELPCTKISSPDVNAIFSQSSAFDPECESNTVKYWDC